MGIKGLTKLITTECPDAMKETTVEQYTGCKIAIDASMTIYQFLVAVRSAGGGDSNYGSLMLTNEEGEVTSHLQGILSRTVKLMEKGIKPVFVFDGKPPELKGGELKRRKEVRDDAEEKLEAAKESGSIEDIDKYSKRIVHMDDKHNAECKILLSLMGIPVIEAPCEAEAQCAELVKGGIVDGMASEDMDSLTHQAPLLLRHFTSAESKKLPILEFNYNKVLEGLHLNKDEFIDFCILCGCDYCDSIRGIGSKTALKLIQKYHNIETILKNIDKTKYVVPEPFLYKESRLQFSKAEVTPASEIKLTWCQPNVDGIMQFLCKEKGFSEERIRRFMEKLIAARGKACQQRVDNYFTVIPSNSPSKGIKRKSVDTKNSAKKKIVKRGRK